MIYFPFILKGENKMFHLEYMLIVFLFKNKQTHYRYHFGMNFISRVERHIWSINCQLQLNLK